MQTLEPSEAVQTFLRTLAPDRRTTLCEVGFSDKRLQGVADASLEPALRAYAAEKRFLSEVHFSEPTLQKIIAPRAFLLRQPEPAAETVSEALHGETVNVFDTCGAFRRVATRRDGYLGWVSADALGSSPEPTHRFAAPRGHVFAAPKVQSVRLFELSYGAELHVGPEPGGEREDAWSRVRLAHGEQGETGFVRSALLRPLSELAKATPENVVAFAGRFLEAPYRWGGTTAWGLDCSGLVQTVYAAHGVTLPRDADQQEACGREVGLEGAQLNGVQPADLLFFPGHVALSLGGTRLLHANAHHMRVTIDDFTADAYGASLREVLTQVRRVLVL